MSSRIEIVNKIYNSIDEDKRLISSRQGQLEYFLTMHFVHQFLKPDSKILEIGAGTGRYSIAFAKEGYDVTAVELVENNLKVLKKNAEGLDCLKSYQGDATQLTMLDDNSFDVTLVFGPLYHLYDEVEVNKSIDEAIRVTKKGGVIFFAFLSVYQVMNSNYLCSGFKGGIDENFTSDYKVRHFKEQFFTAYDIVEFENLFNSKNVSYINTLGVDGVLEAVEARTNLNMSDEDFEACVKYHIEFADKRELLGSNSHLLYVCKKK